MTAEQAIYDFYVDLDDLPTPDDVASDLTTIVHSLERFPSLRLAGLEALPSVRDWKPPGRGPQHSEPERRALAIEYAVTDAIETQPQAEEKRALEALFTFGDRERPVNVRQASAADALGHKSGDSFRRSGEPRLLGALANNLYRHELLHSLRRYDAIRDGARMGATWWRTVELDWAVTIAAERPNEQVWQFRHILRCMMSVSQPLFVITLPWTGIGTHEMETVEVLSGPSHEDFDSELAHTLLRIRPALPGDRDAMAYIWDLGAPLTEGDEVELNFTQRLVDHANAFIPVNQIYTRPDSILRRIRLRAKIPSSMAVRMRGEMAQKPLWKSDDGSVLLGPTGPPTERVPINLPDSDGYYVYEPEMILPNHDYVLRWDK